MSDNSRRKLLKSIAVGSGAIVAGKKLPDSWSRPVVDSVMLPAHAQTSIAPMSPMFGGTSLIPVVDANDSILDNLVPTAQAGALSMSNDRGCATLLANGNLEIYTQFESNSKRRMGEFMTDGTPGTLDNILVADGCNNFDLDAYVADYNPGVGFVLVFLDDIKIPNLYFPLVGSCTTSSWPDVTNANCGNK